ncbi:hypothetical protein SynSYN20_01467 [Synechococcus sp. SYN20]|nr:hypothetical protein SynSYN20_01467 [Synechococcus sp. SYN20]
MLSAVLKRKKITYQVLPVLRAIRQDGHPCHHRLKGQESGF